MGGGGGGGEHSLPRNSDAGDIQMVLGGWRMVGLCRLTL